MAGLSVSVQTAGSSKGTGDLRALSTKIRLELVVRVAEHLAGGGRVDCAANGAGPATRIGGCSATVRGQSVSESATEAGACGAVAILVHHAGRKARNGNVVEARAAGIVCANHGAGSGRKNRSVAVAAAGGTTGMRRKGPLLRELLDFRDVVASEPDEDGFGRRLAIDPILNIVAFGVALADFVVGLAHGSNDFFAVHADNRPALLNGFLHLRRQGVDPLHRGRALVLKIEEGRKNFLQFLRRHVRNELIPLQEDSAAHAGLQSRRAGFLGRGWLHGGIGAAADADLKMISPVMLATPAAI